MKKLKCVLSIVVCYESDHVTLLPVRAVFEFGINKELQLQSTRIRDGMFSLEISTFWVTKTHQILDKLGEKKRF